MANHRCELDVARLAPNVRQRFSDCLSGRAAPRPLWSLPVPASQSWIFLLLGGAVGMAVMAWAGGDKLLGWPWITGWFLATALFVAGIIGGWRLRKNAALGLPEGAYLFASDFIEVRDGKCLLYDLDSLTEIRPKAVYDSKASASSEVDLVFGREVVAIRMPGKQTAQSTINKFWPARETLLTGVGAGDWGEVSTLDPLFEARYFPGWDQVRRLSADLVKMTTIDEKTGVGILGLPPAVWRWAAIGAVVAAPLLWWSGNYWRESRAFSRAQSLNSVASWSAYLKRDQPRNYLEVKQEYLPKAALRAAKKDGSATALRDFLARYGNNAEVAAEAKQALHTIYAEADQQAQAQVAAPARASINQLFRWLEEHNTNLLEVRFGASSAAKMAGIDEFIAELIEVRGIRVPIAPVGASLAENIVSRKEDELVAAIKEGFATYLRPDILQISKGASYSGIVAGLDRPSLAINLFANPGPKLIPDVDTRQFYLGLTFSVECNLFVPGQPPFATSFEIPFEEKVPLVRGKDNFYDGMVAYTYEETAVRLAESLFPKQHIERRVRLIEAPSLPGQTGAGNGAPRRFTATGFCISTDGYIVTAHHFTSDAKTFKVNTKGGKVGARLVASDPEHDLAILKAEGTFPSALALRSSETVKLGESIAVVGFPRTDVQGREPKIGRGEVASLSGMRDDSSTFQISAPVQPGNSGGPLLDLHGNVVGVVVALLREAQVVNYAVKSSHLSRLCERIPELRSLAPQKIGTFPSFEDMLEGVLPATLLLEGYQ